MQRWAIEFERWFWTKFIVILFKKKIANHNNLTGYFVIFTTFIKYFCYVVSCYLSGFSLHLRKLLKKSKNFPAKVTNRTNLVSKKRFTLKLLLDSFFSKQCIQMRKNKNTHHVTTNTFLASLKIWKMNKKKK